MGLHDLTCGSRGILKQSGEGFFLPAPDQHVSNEVDTVSIGKGQRFFHINRRVLELHRIGSTYQHSLLESIDHLRGILQRLANRRQHVIDQNHHGLAFNHCLPGAADFVVGNVLPGNFLLLVQVGVIWLHVFFEVERLVLQSMS